MVLAIVTVLEGTEPVTALLFVRWLIAVLFGFIFLCSAIFHNSLYLSFFITPLRRWTNPENRNISSAPLLGGLLGMLAVLIVPIPGIAKWWWIPLVVDFGCLPFVIVQAYFWIFENPFASGQKQFRKCGYCSEISERYAMHCANCGRFIGSDALVRDVELTILSAAESSAESMICPKCHSQEHSRHNYCSYCGQSLADVVDTVN
jgi:hypothetical protein